MRSGGSGPLSAEEAASSLQQPHAAISTHALMSDGNSATDLSTSDAAVTQADATAAAQPQTQPPADSQTQSQPDQLAIASMSVDELIQSMVLVLAHPPDEFVRRQLGLLLLSRPAAPHPG